MNKNITNVIAALSAINLGKMYEPFIKYEAITESLHFGFRDINTQYPVAITRYTLESMEVECLPAGEVHDVFFEQLQIKGLDPEKKQSEYPVCVDLTQAPKSLLGSYYEVNGKPIPLYRTPLISNWNKWLLIIVISFVAGVFISKLD